MRFDRLLCLSVLWLGLTLAGAIGAEHRDTTGDFQAQERVYKVTEEAQVPVMTLESNRSVSPSIPLYNLLKDNRITWFVMCNRTCENLRETLRHVAEWVNRYGEFGGKAHVFLHHESGGWVDLDTLQKDFGKELSFYTGQDYKNLAQMMTSFEVDMSPAIFVSTNKGFLMGRMTGYSPRDLREWNDYFGDMFRPLIRQKLRGAPPPPLDEDSLDPEESDNEF